MSGNGRKIRYEREPQIQQGDYVRSSLAGRNVRS